MVISGSTIHTKTDNSLSTDSLSGYQHFFKPKAVCRVHIESATESHPTTVNRTEHLFPTVKIGICTHIHHGTVIPEGGYALAFQSINEHLTERITFNTSPFAGLEESEAEFNFPR